MIVTEWNPREPAKAVEVRRLGYRQRLPPAIIGLLGTLMLHVIAVQSFVVLGTGAQKPPARKRPYPESTDTNNGAADPALVLLQPIARSKSASLFEQFASHGLAPRIVRVGSNFTPSVPNIPIDADDDSTATIASGDTSAHARLLGIYSGQIRARIERIWRRPRTPVSDPNEQAGKTDNLDDTFQCQVQIVQDKQGSVQEVLLQRCNGSAAWQRSLVLAINQASPLPAPPDPVVFSQSVTLTFLGLSYAKGNPPDEYENPPPPLARSGTP